MTRCCCGFSWFDRSDLKKPSNETLLLVAFVSFLTFAMVQLVVALIAKSEAMLGDCAAMAVDVMTYGFNLIAERKKHENYETAHVLETLDIDLPTTSSGGETNTTTHEVGRVKLDRQLRSKRRQLHLELVPPVMSVSFLMIVTGFVLRQSIHTLILDSHRNEKEQSRPNLVLMMTFSTLNLLLDVINVVCFARAKHLMGYNTEEKEIIGLQNYNMIDNEGLIEDHVTHSEFDDAVGGIVAEHNTSFNERMVSEKIDEDDHVNLNMCSAYTHVFADTLRSIAVIVASVIAETVDSVTSEVADSTAAVIVSFIIMMSLCPLFRGIAHTSCELRSLSDEEQALSENDKSELGVEMS